MVLASDFLFDFSNLLREKFNRSSALRAHHVVMAAPVVLVLIAGNAVVEGDLAGQAALRQQLQGAIDGVGESLPQDGPSAQWYAARLDACSRWQGLYSNGQGLAFTVCVGTEGGMTHDSAAAGAADKGYLAFGPAVDLRGDIAENMSAALRGVGGLDAFPQGWSGRFELALAWRMP
jgi:hypothetical protein